MAEQLLSTYYTESIIISFSDYEITRNLIFNSIEETTNFILNLITSSEGYINFYHKDEEDILEKYLFDLEEYYVGREDIKQRIIDIPEEQIKETDIIHCFIDKLLFKLTIILQTKDYVSLINISSINGEEGYQLLFISDKHAIDVYTKLKDSYHDSIREFETHH